MTTSTHWLRALRARPGKHIRTLAASLCEQGGWQLRHKTLPQAGLGMLQLADNALNDRYNLGEFPFASAWLAITLPDGRTVEGAAQIMDDDLALAEALAVCDAVLRHQLPGWEAVQDELAAGLARLDAEQRERAAMLARTRVDFSLLDASDDDDD